MTKSLVRAGASPEGGSGKKKMKVCITYGKVLPIYKYSFQVYRKSFVFLALQGSQLAIIVVVSYFLNICVGKISTHSPLNS